MVVRALQGSHHRIQHTLHKVGNQRKRIDR